MVCEDMADIDNLLNLVKLQVNKIVIDIAKLQSEDKIKAFDYLDESLKAIKSSTSRSEKRNIEEERRCGLKRARLDQFVRDTDEAAKVKVLADGAVRVHSEEQQQAGVEVVTLEEDGETTQIQQQEPDKYAFQFPSQQGQLPSCRRPGPTRDRVAAEDSAVNAAVRVVPSDHDYAVLARDGVQQQPEVVTLEEEDGGGVGQAQEMQLEWQPVQWNRDAVFDRPGRHQQLSHPLNLGAAVPVPISNRERTEKLQGWDIETQTATDSISFENRNGSIRNMDDCSKSHDSNSFDSIAADIFGKFPCPESNCDKTFTKRWSLKEHFGSHTGEWTCKECHSVLANKRNFGKHMESFHGNPSNPQLISRHTNIERKTEQVLDVETEQALVVIQEQNGEYSVKQLVSHSRKVVPSQNKSIDGEFEVDSSGKFLCPHTGCEKSFTRKFNVRDHFGFHTNYAKVKCNICQLVLSNKRSLKRHLLCLHGLNQEVQSSAVETEQEVVQILDTVSDSLKPTNGSLNLSSSTFKARDSKSCQNITPSLIEGTRYLKPLKAAVMEQVDGEGKFSCRECEQKLSSPWCLKRHIERKHISHPAEEVIPSLEAMRAEEDSVQLKLNELYQLSEPEFGVVDLKSITEEEIGGVGTSDKGFTCSKCDKKFTRRWILKQHMETHTGKHKCTVCQLVLANQFSLRRHQKSQHECSEQKEAEAPLEHDEMLKMEQDLKAELESGTLRNDSLATSVEDLSYN